MKHITRFQTKMVFALILVQVLSIHTASATVACANKMGGSYNFGIAPYFCNVSAFSTATKTKAEFSPVIYDDSKSSSSEREAYMSNLYPVFREVAKYYIHRRNSKVSANEEEAFLAAVYTLATQESYWSHYRVGTDKVLRYMRGDSLHGYGFMQLDDRSHATQIAKGIGQDMIENMTAGLDIYYAAWIQSKTARCIASTSDYKNRARAAWAAYNGGPGAICRWTSTNSHDTQYLGNFNARRWLPLVKDTAAPAKLNVACLMEGTRPCALHGTALARTPVVTPPATHPAPVTPSTPVLKQATLSSKYPYRVLRECADVSCGHVSGALLAGERVSILGAPVGDWVQVAALNDSRKGWLKTSDLEGM